MWCAAHFNIHSIIPTITKLSISILTYNNNNNNQQKKMQFPFGHPFDDVYVFSFLSIPLRHVNRIYLIIIFAVYFSSFSVSFSVS